ncbi:MAG: 30S ribosome-binding factor RbfA [Candidatus Bathyarchaeota archaeon]|nr:30S ribosome-binding factor RbfA [Candidatus Bathyarchaeota archaeon]
MTRRIERVNSLLHEEISKTLLKEVDFGEALVTITNVHTTRDLLESDIFITVLPQGKERTVLKILKANIYNIQKMLNKKLNMRPIPKIHFKIDEGMKNFYRINNISQKNINHEKQDKN